MALLGVETRSSRGQGVAAQSGFARDGNNHGNRHSKVFQSAQGFWLHHDARKRRRGCVRPCICSPGSDIAKRRTKVTGSGWIGSPTPPRSGHHRPLPGNRNRQSWSLQSPLVHENFLAPQRCQRRGHVTTWRNADLQTLNCPSDAIGFITKPKPYRHAAKFELGMTGGRLTDLANLINEALRQARRPGCRPPHPTTGVYRRH